MSERDGLAGAWWGIVGNLVLTLLKVIGGLLFQSQALLADGVHNLSDLMGSVAVLVGRQVARVPADAGHPYGHQKAESVAQKIVAILLLLAGLEILVSAIGRLLSQRVEIPAAAGLWIMGVSIVIKAALFLYQYRLGQGLGSKALLAGAQDNRADVYSSLAALLGIALARMGYPLADPLAAAAVSILVIRIGWQMVTEAIDDLMDKFSDQDFLTKVREVALGVPEVQGIDQVKARALGTDVQIDLEIAVMGDLRVEEGHQVADRVRDEIMAQLPRVTEVRVHVNPFRLEAGGVSSPGRE